MKIILLVLAILLSAKSSFAVDYYIDFARTSNGTGTEANPWKERFNIDWSAITASLAGGPVTLYFSSRANWNDDGYIIIPANFNATTNRFTMDGQSKYNLTASGTAVWLAEGTSSRAILADAGSGGSILVDSPNQFMTVRGFVIDHGTSGGIVFGYSNPTTNMHDIIVENNYIDTPDSLQGIWFGYAETGCYNFTIRNNTVIATPSEAIYVGHFDYLSDTITGVIVESNIILNTGTASEGDIDIKGGVFGAIVRYNTVYRTSTGGVLAGIVIQASDVQAYGNSLHNLSPNNPVDGGSGIQINADGIGGVGKTLANVLIYNNLIYSNTQNGIIIFATNASALITNLKILNNTIVSNTLNGIKTSASGGGAITIAELQNNIISANGSYAFYGTADVTITSSNYNVLRGTGTILRYADVDKTYAAWQMLGFDANSTQADPLLNTAQYPNVGSPVIDTGLTQTEFSVDYAGTSRPQHVIWDIGAYEYIFAPSGNRRFGKKVP